MQGNSNRTDALVDTYTVFDKGDLFGIDVSRVVQLYARDVEGRLYHFPYVLDDWQHWSSHKPLSRAEEWVTVFGVAPDSWGERLFVFYVADCAFPPFYFVFGQSFEDAYEWFIDYREEDLAIPPEDVDDYTNEQGAFWGSYSANGTPVDAEGVNGFEVDPVFIVLAADVD